MVFYFTLHSDPSVKCYMGRDKHENEDLIRWGWPEDIWFHVDSHSSAHVYIRMPPGKGMDDLTPEMIEEACQLTKANSIEGCKLNNIKIVYTPWSNLHKQNSMDVGAVGFHKESLRRFYTVAKKDTFVINRLEKTRVERDQVDFRQEREQRDEEERHRQRERQREERERQKAADLDARTQEELRTYKALNDESQMRRNTDGPMDEDDFM